MKAKEYAKKYEETGDLEEILTLFIEEIRTLARIRNAKTDLAFIGIFNELDQKWKAFSRLTGLADWGFSELIRTAYPEVYKIWRGDK